MGTRKEKLGPLRRFAHEQLATSHTVIDLQTKLNKKKRIGDEEATSRTVMEALGAPNPRRMAQTDPSLNTRWKLCGHRSGPIEVPAESNVLLAQDPTAYIDWKLEEFHRQFARYNPRSTTENQSIFSPAIDQYQIPARVKLPKILGKYLGMTSPSEHLDNYAVYMALNPDHDALKYKLFRITLGEYAQTWYINLPKGSIGSFTELKEKFLAQFASSEPIWRPIEILHKIIQGLNESLRYYMTHFSRAALTISYFVDQTR